jgi:hypothetical protein
LWLGEIKVEGDENEVEDGGSDSDAGEDYEELETETHLFTSGPRESPSTYRLTKTIPHKNVRVQTLIASYTATQFLPSLSAYIKSAHISPIEPSVHD